MSEPVNPPSTEAGRDLLSRHDHYDVCRDPECLSREQDFTNDILAIEAAARDEGRQQAVRLLREWVNLYEAPDAHAEAKLAHATVLYLGVAGLNASESPRKPGCIYKHPHPEHECRNQDDMRGDASESPPHEDEVERLIRLTEDIFGDGPRVITDWRKFYSVLVGDAIESGQPSEASDE